MLILLFDSIKVFLESKVTLRERILAIDSLIDKMILSIADGIDNANISEYQLDDGQVKIKTAYRSPSEVQSGIKSLEQMKQLYINRLNGRGFCLRDEKSYLR